MISGGVPKSNLNLLTSQDNFFNVGEETIKNLNGSIVRPFLLQ